MRAGSFQVASAVAVLLAACGGEPPPPAAGPAPAQADPWRIVARPSSDPPGAAGREEPAASAEARQLPPAPTSPSVPGGVAPPAPAPDPCAAYVERTITCTGPLRHMDQCTAEASAERRVAAIRSKMRRCYDDALQRDPGLAPKGELAFTDEVDANGCVLRTTPLRADPSYPPALVACIARAMGLLDAVPKGVAVTRRTQVVAGAP